jgi:hypothetical protein
MSHRADRLQLTTPRRPTIGHRWVLLLHALVMLALILLPVQMRAGASEAHPHSLLQLLLDAGDGTIDHHTLESGIARADGHAAEEAAICLSDPDVPSVEDSGQLGGSLSMLSAIGPTLLLQARNGDPVWPMSRPWQACIPELEPPPPRIERV